MAAAPRPRSALRNTLFAGIVLVAALALAEGAARLWWSPPEAELPPDPRLRWSLPASGALTLEGHTHRINRHGYRGPGFDVDRAPCSYRIYAAGDSSVFGHGVPDGQAFVELLPALLLASGEVAFDVEAINGAVPGFSTYQSLRRLEDDGWALRPDLLLIGNLWSDAAPADVPDAELFGEAGAVTEAFPHGPTGVLAVSRLVQLGRSLLLPGEPVYGDDGAAFRRVSSADYRANLERMIAGVRERGGEALVLVLPFSTDVGAPDGRTEFEHEYRQILRDVAAARGAPLVDMVPVVRPDQRALFLDDLHPNQAGHYLIASELQRALLARPSLFDGVRQRCKDEAGVAGGVGDGAPAPG